MRGWCAFVLFCVVGISLCQGQIQPKFDTAFLLQPKKFSKELEKQFKIVQTKKVNPKALKNSVALPNGYAESKLSKTEAWETVKEQVKVKEVSMVFSRYPKNFEQWATNYHELLAKRLLALFEVDPDLNNREITFTLVLQTDCETEEDAKKLFHGFLIKYDKLSPKELAAKQKANASKPEAVLDLGSVRKRVDRYVKSTGGMLDSGVYKVLSRHPQWKNTLMVVDWTSSMYEYSAQCLVWHLDHYDSSTIKYFAFFNDGDDKWESEKTIGQTGGIYFAPADNMGKVVRVFNTAMRKGLGGEMPENDIEAILKAIDQFSNFDHLVLVGDNSMIRDFELWENIKRPVHVILADADAYAVNPQYINLAFLTKGSFHTSQIDLYFDAQNIPLDSPLQVSGFQFIFDKDLGLWVCADKKRCRYMDQEIEARERKKLNELKSKPAYRNMAKEKKLPWYKRLFRVFSSP